MLLKANGLAQAGILLNNPKVPTAASGYPGEALLENVQRGVKRALRCNDPSMLFTLTGTEDGLYADGSYIQHQGIPYIAGYGVELYRNYAVLARVLGGTGRDITHSYRDDHIRAGDWLAQGTCTGSAAGVSDPTQRAASIAVTPTMKYCGTTSRDSAITVDERETA